VVTTINLPFGEWTKVFPESRLCKAVVDRLTFNADIVEAGTESLAVQEDDGAPAPEGVRRKAG
jgi:DNA replication protein DnaC